MAEILAVITAWIRDHIGLIFTGTSGAVVGAIFFDGNFVQKITSFFVGCIMAFCLAAPASQILYEGKMIELFGFCIGVSGMTLAKLLLIYIEKFAKTKAGISNESKEG